MKVKFTSCRLTTPAQSFVGLSSCSSTRCSKIYKVSENSFIINTRLYDWWGVHKWLMNVSAESAFGHIEFIILVKNMQRSLFPAVCPHDPALAPWVSGVLYVCLAGSHVGMIHLLYGAYLTAWPSSSMDLLLLFRPLLWTWRVVTGCAVNLMDGS